VQVVCRQFPKFLYAGFDDRERRLIGFQIRVVSSDEITTLASFGILEIGQQIGQPGAYLIGVGHPFVVPDEAIGVSIARYGKQQQRQTGKPESCRQPSSERPIVEQLYCFPLDAGFLDTVAGLCCAMTSRTDGR